MTRFKALIAYDGTDFYGWQTQREEPTVQSTLESCLRQICGRQVSVIGSGRTDSGVHALGQVAHFDWDHHLSAEKLPLAINAIVPFSVRVQSVEPVEPDFNARINALSKSYLYRIDRNRNFDPFNFRYALHNYSPLDLDLMRHLATMIEGEHDFSAFQAAGTDIVNTNRTVFCLEIFEPSGDLLQAHRHFLFLRIRANGFLRKMVRFLVGTLIEIGSGKRPPEHMKRALESGDKGCVGVPAPARGLFLEKVYYE